MAKFIDITDQTFGRLTAVEFSGIKDKHGNRLWRCLCICGNESLASVANLKRGNTRSCGCLMIDITIQRSTTHGMRYTPEWHIWAQMVGRCNNPKNKGYKNYGGRGITIEDPAWLKFENFYRDMGSRPSPELTLERANNNRGYYKENCLWADRFQQAGNRRNVHLISMNGEIKSIAAWARILGFSAHPIYHRIWRGMEPIKAFWLSVNQLQRRP